MNETFEQRAWRIADCFRDKLTAGGNTDAFNQLVELIAAQFRLDFKIYSECEKQYRQRIEALVNPVCPKCKNGIKCPKCG